ncbi:uncharacterized protein CTHT_0065280 [Thermochaetoides thermophila DSM 1495]|uniref:Uncharacterized protein n=1 Tax=Chaetomium thermophilum (strain DSM 1495 / CBS 144.50 / IMI 039719) TaxID=759272 RepID=G0SG72_CHATD|nr:hypothetical protein CTHT_0065280 [Thermochaetoides thermophila DSM 1495]EGS17211.1 hypothetical protein CTHT_0065280 [Thermochaetoides thermophila DSM 1495]
MGTLPTLPKEVDGESGFLTASDVEPEEAGTTPGTGNGIVKGGVVVTADGSSTSPSGQGQIVHVNGLPVVVSKKMLKARRLATSLNIAHSQPRIRPPSIYNAVNPTIINPAVRSRASLLLYPGRPLTHTTHTRLSVKQLAAAKQRQKRKKKEEEAAEKARLAYAKRFDKKIRGDKVVQVDFRKRVRLWMKGVQAAIGEEGFGEVEFDGEGLPIYR